MAHEEKLYFTNGTGLRTVAAELPGSFMFRQISLVLRCAASTVILMLAASAYASDAFPSRPVRIIVPFPAGGPTDSYARMLGQRLSENIGQPVVVENRPGGTGLIGTTLVKDAKPDGHTLLFTSNSAHVIGPLLHQPALFDPTADFTALTALVRYPMYLVTSQKVPANNFKEFISYARENRGKLNYSSVGNGSGGHLTCEILSDALGMNAVHVPYRGAAAAQTALVSGEADFMCDSVGNSQTQVSSGRIKGLAITSARRLEKFPDIPTMAEHGVPIEAYIWLGLFAPKGTPAEIRDRLASEISKIARSPEIIDRVTRDGYELSIQSPAQFESGIRAEKSSWARVVSAKGIKAGQ